MPKTYDYGLDCGAVVSYPYPKLKIDDIVYCHKHKHYGIITNGEDALFVVMCLEGNLETNSSNNDCYAVHQFKTNEKAVEWAEKHEHKTRLYQSPPVNHLEERLEFLRTI